MYNVTGTNITLTKGDTFYCQVEITQDGSSYEPQDGDVIEFHVKKTFMSENMVIEKTISNETLLIHLAPEDTKELSVGDYVYELELTFANGDVDTFIQGKFMLTPEVD